MDLKRVSDTDLVSQTKNAVSEERTALAKVLVHLREIDRRRLYADFKCESINEFAQKHLGYSESEAAIRISAMRLLEDLPEIEDKIADGSLSLSSLNLAQRVFNRTRIEAQQSAEAEQSQPSFAGLSMMADGTAQSPTFESADEKLELLAKIENKSKSEALAIIKSVTHRKSEVFESVKHLEGEQVELKLVLTRSEFEALAKLRNTRAHSKSGLTYSRLITALVEQETKRNDPLEKAKRADTRRVRKTAVPEQKQSVNRQAIPRKVKHSLWLRDKGECTNCGSTRALEIDHIKPLALGGEDAEENLRLLCRACNQRAAIKAFGDKKMEGYLRRN